MNTRSQIIAAWCGPAFMASMLLGWVFIGGYFPPHSPAMDGTEVTEFYQSNLLSIRFGLVVTMLGTMLFIPFSAITALQLARIEGKFCVWAVSQITAAAGTVITLAMPMLFWATAAFRPERSPELILLLDDLGWIPFAGMSAPFLLQPLCVAIVGFMDKSEWPTFPRWFCYFNLWTFLLVMPGCLIIFFKSGPFAWNGLFGIWVPFVIFGIWFCVMTHLLIKSIKRQEAEALASARH